MLNRRNFLGLLGCLTAAGGLGLGISVPLRQKVRLAQLVPATARPLEGTRVVLHGADGFRVDGVLEAVHSRRYRAQCNAPGTEQISFRVRPDRPEAPSGTYRLQAPEVEWDELLFTAVRSEGRDRRLEAVINRIV